MNKFMEMSKSADTKTISNTHWFDRFRFSFIQGSGIILISSNVAQLPINFTACGAVYLTVRQLGDILTKAPRFQAFPLHKHLWIVQVRRPQKALIEKGSGTIGCTTSGRVIRTEIPEIVVHSEWAISSDKTNWFVPKSRKAVFSKSTRFCAFWLCLFCTNLCSL